MGMMKQVKTLLSQENVHIVTMFVLLIVGLINMLPATLTSLVQTKVGPLSIQVILGSGAVFLALYDLLGRIEDGERVEVLVTEPPNGGKPKRPRGRPRKTTQ